MTELLEKLAADVGGRYVVERELGRGGMATVYLARDLLDERRVAIKVMDPELSAAVGAERFKREIDVASRLQHPHILGILGSGEAAGTSYYVMPYVQGETLRDRLEREKQLPIEDAIRIAREVAGALDYAHKQGIVHRDIKPENILLENGRALVADFGIARAASMGDAQKLTKTGTALGTPHYMSPEQIFGEKDIDGRTDEYALACMLHEMLAGQPPFVGPHAQSLMAQHALDDPPLVSRFRATTPSNVEDAIYTALSKTRADRFPTLHDFNVALENTGYTSLMKITKLQRAATQSQLQALQKPTPLWKKAFVVAAGLVLMVGGTAAAWNLIQKTKPNDAATVARLKKVAVLYLSADGEPADVALLAEGLTEGLITQLRGVQGLSVVSRDGVLPFRETRLPIDSVAARLDVGTVATGSVRRDGDQLRVTVRLDQAGGGELGKVALSLPVRQGTAIRDSLATLVSMKLREIIGGELEVVRLRGATSSMAAWTLLQGGERARRVGDSLTAAENIEAARARYLVADSLFAGASSADARWSAPLVGRGRAALALARLADHERSRTKAAPWLDSAEMHATRALAIAPTDAEAFEVRGAARSTRVLFELVTGVEANATYEVAKADLDTATTLDATRASAWIEKSRLEYAKKNIPQGLSLLQQAYAADAYLAEAPTVLNRLFVTSYDLDQYQQAERYCNEGYRRFPDRIGFVHCKLRLAGMRGSDATPAQVWAIVDSLKQRTAPARREYKAKEFEMYAAVALIRAGLPDSARRVMERARLTAADDPSGEVMGLEALVLAQLGDTEAAVRQLQLYISAHPDHIVGFKKADFWWWKSLREDKRFRDILALAARS